MSRTTSLPAPLRLSVVVGLLYGFLVGVSLLEGGYDLAGLADSVAAHVGALMAAA